MWEGGRRALSDLAQRIEVQEFRDMAQRLRFELGDSPLEVEKEEVNTEENSYHTRGPSVISGPFVSATAAANAFVWVRQDGGGGCSNDSGAEHSSLNGRTDRVEHRQPYTFGSAPVDGQDGGKDLYSQEESPEDDISEEKAEV
ncbi:hypothetical protein Micbo1qcDRAFT_171375 [Microdochium bolleyi]|uniref:Uncharacterized protein n=1 Tax=Microdochium bolleyi TaxID=196109 RepID=A0A136JCP7_9PEZI|nr:hypothetical protein Micbo1qcDRAFT_171375 [Microdochium bolleyi]